MTTRQRLPRADQLLSSLDTYVLSFAPVPTIPYYPNTGNQWPFIIILAVLLLYWTQFTQYVVCPRKVSELATPGLDVLAQTLR